MPASDRPRPAQHRRMHALWRAAGVTDRADRLALTSAFVGQLVTSSNELSAEEAAALIRYMTRLENAEQLQQRVAEWLESARKEAP